MIPVQVGHRHPVDRVRIKPLGLERHQAGSAAIDQQHLPLGGQVDARLPSPAATERVTTTSEPDPHDGILTHRAPGRTDARGDRRHIRPAIAVAQALARPASRPVPG